MSEPAKFTELELLAAKVERLELLLLAMYERDPCRNRMTAVECEHAAAGLPLDDSDSGLETRMLNRRIRGL